MSNGVIREWFRMESSVGGNGGWLCWEATGQGPVCSRQPLAGLRCTHGVSGPGRDFPAMAPGSCRNIGHRSHPSKNPVLRASRRTAKPFNSPWALSGHQCAFLCRALHLSLNPKVDCSAIITCSCSNGQVAGYARISAEQCRSIWKRCSSVWGFPRRCGWTVS